MSQLNHLEALESDLVGIERGLHARSRGHLPPARRQSFRCDHETDRIRPGAHKMPKRKPIKADYLQRRALWLPEKSRYETIMALPTGSARGQALNDAMTAIENKFTPLAGVLPKEFSIIEPKVLEDLLRIFHGEALRTATGDVFGRIYEYLLMKFAIQGDHDNGEFFTPPSIVQTIVNVIESEHGVVFDPACGSGGMFVQSSHFIERLGQDTSKRVTF